MNCPRCNNTHWTPSQHRNSKEWFAILLLCRPYRCLKCDFVRLGLIFLHREARPSSTRDKTLSEAKRCMECGLSLSRSKRRGIERLLVRSAYRCNECKIRLRFVRILKRTCVLFDRGT